MKRCSKVDDALALLNNREETFHLIVLDIMMPPGETFTLEETQEGVITGVFLYKRIRERFATLPIIALTNSQNPELDQQFKDYPQTKLLRKKDWPPFKLATEIGAMISPPL